MGLLLSSSLVHQLDLLKHWDLRLALGPEWDPLVDAQRFRAKLASIKIQVTHASDSCSSGVAAHLLYFTSWLYRVVCVTPGEQSQGITIKHRLYITTGRRANVWKLSKV